MWPRHRIDITWRDLASAAFACVRPGAADAAAQQVERRWSPNGDLLACLSVRSGWDLLLQSVDWPAGSEVLMSAMTIPDMAAIVRHHGFVPVPLDVDVDTLAPPAESIGRAVTPRTKAVLIAHLFGGRIDLSPFAEAAKSSGLMLIEDCAQAFRGPEYLGDPAADVSMFSFGPIKTATALGGALLRVGNRELLASMRMIQDGYAPQGRWAFLGRTVKYAGLRLLSGRIVFSAFAGLCRWTGRDHNQFIGRVSRGFADGGVERYRRRPSAPMMRLLNRRLLRYSRPREQRRCEVGRALRQQLSGHAPLPGSAVNDTVNWVFAILCDEPADAIRRLQQSGFDAAQGTSMCAIDPPPDRPELHPATARDLLARMVFVPAYPELRPRDVGRLAAAIIDAATSPIRPAATAPAARARG
jgi:perosamine synthetase